MNYQALRDMLVQDEGLKFKVYLDSKGIPTIGVGRNLKDVGISRDEAMLLLDNDIKAATELLDQSLPWWRGMSDVRQHVIINMAFNLGSRLLGFKLALAAMESGDYHKAAQEMKNSQWYTEVGARAIRLCSLMENGV